LQKTIYEILRVSGMRNKLASWGLLLCLPIAACTNQASQPKASPPADSPAPSPVESVMVASPVASASPSPEVDRYHDALNAAAAARSISETALDKDDWALVAAQWQNSIKMLKAVPKDSTNYSLAPQYQQNLTKAQQKSTNFKQKPVGGGEVEPVAVVEQSKSFSMPIVKKLNNIPVVEVFINGQKVQMLFDTGASKTLITKGTATRLQLTSQGQTKAMTASGDAKFDTVKLDSVEFGQGKVTDLVVAVGNNEQNYGLLGHDVYKGYEITLAEETIEFKKK
jgi:clan AA aspartic protease (TIGR02281 family)